MDDLRTPGGVAVAGHALKLEVSRSGGPGGQHVNTSSTKVGLVLDVERGLPAEVAERVRERHGEVLRVTVSKHRSQARNRAEAVERLLSRIDEALEVQAPRAATKIPYREKRRRREDKLRRSRRLQDRRGD